MSSSAIKMHWLAQWHMLGRLRLESPASRHLGTGAQPIQGQYSKPRSSMTGNHRQQFTFTFGSIFTPDEPFQDIYIRSDACRPMTLHWFNTPELGIQITSRQPCGLLHAAANSLPKGHWSCNTSAYPHL